MIKPFEKRVLLSSPTMHNNEEMKYVQEAYDTNWMSTVGENINEVEKQLVIFDFNDTLPLGILPLQLIP